MFSHYAVVHESAACTQGEVLARPTIVPGIGVFGTSIGALGRQLGCLFVTRSSLRYRVAYAQMAREASKGPANRPTTIIGP